MTRQFIQDEWRVLSAVATSRVTETTDSHQHVDISDILAVGSALRANAAFTYSLRHQLERNEAAETDTHTG